jgi:hypothetical protein
MLLVLRVEGRCDASSATGPATIGQDARMPLQRIAWLVTVAAALITALLLFVSGYNGYGALAIAVAASAAINLR